MVEREGILIFSYIPAFSYIPTPLISTLYHGSSLRRIWARGPRPRPCLLQIKVTLRHSCASFISLGPKGGIQ